MSDSWTKYHVVVKTTHVVELHPEREIARMIVEECDYLALNAVPSESVEIIELEEIG